MEISDNTLGTYSVNSVFGVRKHIPPVQNGSGRSSSIRDFPLANRSGAVSARQPYQDSVRKQKHGCLITELLPFKLISAFEHSGESVNVAEHRFPVHYSGGDLSAEFATVEGSV